MRAEAMIKAKVHPSWKRRAITAGDKGIPGNLKMVIAYVEITSAPKEAWKKKSALRIVRGNRKALDVHDAVGSSLFPSDIKSSISLSSP
jgi:hypothetical protein